MAINKKLIHFKSKENFEREVANENILDTSICFILDSKEISTHGTVYKTVNWSILEDPFNGHAYVDLGLPSGTLWATSVIKNKLGEPLYFQWGDTEGWTAEQINNGEKVFDYDGLDYKFGEYPHTKYNEDDGKISLAIEDDAAHVHMGGDWRVPSIAQLLELTKNTTFIWTTLNSVNGRLYTSTINGKSIFIPAFGGVSNSSLDYVGSRSYIWSKSVGDELSCAWCLTFSSLDTDLEYFDRTYGHCVLGVIKPKS